jgi:3-methyladenine DNA glycosylase/8-oxoguanine DNA glycosylase
MEKVPPSEDSWAAARAALRAADPRMASLVDADPTLDPDAVLDGWPTDLWDALVFNVVGQQLSVAASAILARLRALHEGRLPTPAELLATDTEALRRAGLSRAKTSRSAYRMVGSISSECGISTTTQPARSSCRSRASGDSPLTVC